MRFTASLCIPVLCAIAACTPAKITLAPTTSSFGPDTPVLNRAGNNLTISVGGLTVNGTVMPESVEKTTFAVATDAGLMGFAALKETANLRVGFGTLNPDKNGGTAGSGAFVQRLVAGEIEKSGTATFKGNYVGILGEGTALPLTSVDSILVGKATLNADFGEETVSGVISERAFVALNFVPVVQPGVSIKDIVLAPTAITEAGTFSGKATGGEITTDNFAPMGQGQGTSTGVFAGATGQEVGGAVAIATKLVDKMDPNNAPNVMELGAFHATRQ